MGRPSPRDSTCFLQVPSDEALGYIREVPPARDAAFEGHLVLQLKNTRFLDFVRLPALFARNDRYCSE